MKGYYITIETPSKDDHSGVGLKIRSQINCFNDADLNCKEITIPQQKGKLLTLGYRVPLCSAYRYRRYIKVLKSADYIYLRRPYVINAEIRDLFKKVRKENPLCKIIMEIPTYPYDSEYQTKKLSSMILNKDKYNRKRLIGLVDRFAILTDEKEVFGIPTIKISNGIDVNKIEKKQDRSEEGVIHMCAVAMFCEWHGYERIIEGLKKYYDEGGNRNIMIHFIGEGPEEGVYRDLVKKYQLEDHAVFCGFLDGNELKEIYDRSTVALGSFGMYKIGIDLSCNLKSREALARGIPMITGCPTDVFNSDSFKYFLEFPNDPSTVDVRKIIDFCDRIHDEGISKVTDKIREYAYETVTMEAAMKNVIDFIRS